MPASTAKANSALTVTMPSDREIVMTRVFDAPRRLVFEACTKPEHLLRWFGPHSCPLVECQVDLRVGGRWRYILRGPDGRNMGMRGVYREIAPYHRLISTESFDDYPGESLNTLTFLREGRKDNAHHPGALRFEGDTRRRDPFRNGARSGRNL